MGKFSLVQVNRRLLYISMGLVVFLIPVLYQNCAPAKFSRDESSEMLVLPPVIPEIPQVADVVVDITVTTTTTTTTTTMPSVVVINPVTTTTTTSTTTTTLPSKQKIYSATVASDLVLPQIDFKFIIDNSLSMSLNNTNVSEAVGVMFSSSTGNQNLNIFDVTGEVYTTAQNNIYMDSSNYKRISGLYDSIGMRKDYGADAVIVQNNITAFVNSITTARALVQYPISSMNPGDALGYIQRVTEYNGDFNGTLIPYTKVYEKSVNAFPVNDVVGGKLSPTLVSRQVSGNDYNSFVNNLKLKISRVSPENTKQSILRDIPVEYQSNFQNLALNPGYSKGLVNEESGLCATARILKQQKKKLQAMTSAELDVYKKNTPRSVFVLVSDENDEFASGERCLDKFYDEKGTDQFCSQDEYYLHYSYDRVQNFPASCSVDGPNTLSAKMDVLRKDTQIKWQTFTIQKKCIESNETGCIKYQDQQIPGGYRYYYASGDYSANCTPTFFNIAASEIASMMPGTFSCTYDSVGELNNGSANSLSYQLGFDSNGGVIAKGALTAIFVNDLWKNNIFPVNCPATLVPYMNESGSPVSSRNYLNGFRDPSKYQYSNCQITAKTNGSWAAGLSLDTQLKCDQNAKSYCGGHLLDSSLCTGNFTASYSSAPNHQSTYIDKVFFNPLVQYSCDMLCSVWNPKFFCSLKFLFSITKRALPAFTSVLTLSLLIEKSVIHELL